MSDLGNKDIMSENLKYYIEKSGKDRRELANIWGFPYSTVSEWINGRKYPRIDRIEIMADYFGIQKSDLIEKKGDAPMNGGASPERQLLNRIIEELPDEKVDQLLQLIRVFREDDR